jgi:hypothetical protein
MEEREVLIRDILDMELQMFLSVSAREPVSCQQDPEGFRVTRGAQFSVWSEQTLHSYREDLRKAVQQGRNLMTLKYARMENMIPKLQDDIVVENLVGQIVAIQVDWQREMIAKYPFLMKRGRPLDEGDEGLQTTSFVNYLRSELETYSAETLAHLYRDMTACQDEDRNMTEAIYEHMVRDRGFASIQEAETAAKMQTTEGKA